MLQGMCDLPGSGIEPVSPALAGGLFTAEPPGKPPSPPFCWQPCCHSGWLTGHGRCPPGGWSGTRPCGTRSTRTGIKRRAAPLPARGVHRWAHGGPISDGNEFQFVINQNSSKNIWQKTAGSGTIYENGLMGDRAAAADGCRRGLS